jgi:hypothetical protein
MIRILDDGIDTYAVIKDDAALGWVSKSHWHGKWRALSVKDNRLTFHYSRMEAVNAIIARTR